MKKLLSSLCVLVTLLGATLPSNGSLVFSDFSDIDQNPYFSSESDWSDQYVIEDGHLTIEPVESGNPSGMGSLLTAFTSDFTPVDLGNATHIALTARLNLGNEITQIMVRFYSLEDQTDIEVGTAIFSASAFSSDQFTLAISPIEFNYEAGKSALSHWIIAGDGNMNHLARVSFDHLEAIPEPSSFVLLFSACAGGLLYRRYRR